MRLWPITIVVMLAALVTGQVCATADGAPAVSTTLNATAVSNPSNLEVKLDSIEIVGRFSEPKAKLLRFLEVRPGMRFDELAEERIQKTLREVLGYQLLEMHIEPTPRGIKLKLRIEPARVVRHIIVLGNFPLFDDEIIRHLSIRSGARLVPDDELRSFLDEEEKRVESFLARDGYFGSKVHITPHQSSRPEWIDLKVRVSLEFYHPYKLGVVKGTGNVAIKNSELTDLFDHCCLWWGRFGIERMRDDARHAEQVLRDRGYPGARVIPDFNFEKDADQKNRRINLPVTVVEKRRVMVKFFGNRNISDKELKEQVTIFASGAYDDIELEESAKSIHRLYQQHGFFEAKVNVTRQRFGTELEVVSFLITEGSELKVRSVEVVAESNQPLHFTSDELKSKAALETKIFPVLGAISLGEGGYVTLVQLQQDVDRLVEFYHGQGFPMVTVRAEVARDPNALGSLGGLGASVAGELGGKDELHVRLFVEEGHREVIDLVEVTFLGAHLKTDRAITKAINLQPGQPYTKQVLVDAQNRVLEQYKSSGRPYVQASFAGSTWDAAHEKISLRCQIDEGDDVVFGEILIRGNFKTHNHVILMDLPFKPGDRFNLAKIEQAETNLRTHLIFTSATVKPIGLEDGRQEVPILVTVQERYLEKLGQTSVGFGVATDKLPNYAYLAGAWTFNNFFGFGSQLELRAETGFADVAWNASIRYTDVRIAGPGWRLDAYGFVRNELTERLGSIRTYGASVGITHLFKPSLRGFLRYDLTLSQLGVGFNRLEGPSDTANEPDNTKTAKFVTGLIWDRRVGADGRPNPIAPVQGWLLSASLGWAFKMPVDIGLDGDHNFLVASAQAMGIWRFQLRSTEFTLIGNLRYDEGIPLFGESALPAVERFFAGGDTTVRGYELDSLKTEIVHSKLSPISDANALRFIPQGGNLRILSTVELQFPIAKTPIGPWVGAVFWDAGLIADAPNLISVSDLKHSIGVALLRFVTSFGTISLDYAYPLTQTAAEERWTTEPWYRHYPGQFHLNWGIPLSRN